MYSTPLLVVYHQNIARPFGTEKLEWCDVSVSVSHHFRLQTPPAPLSITMNDP